VKKQLDGRALPRPLYFVLGLVAFTFAGFWAEHHGYLDVRALREGLRGERFLLRHVDFVGVDALEPDELWRLLEIPAGTALVDVDPEVVVLILAKHPRIERVRASRLPPNRLLVAVTERVPVALEMSTGLGLAENGAVFPLKPGEAVRLPQVSGEAKCALPIIRAASAHGVQLATVHAPRAKDVRVRALGRPTVLVVGRDEDASLLDWKQLADSGLIESTGARVVDLRFRGSPVLRDIPKATGGENGETR
jgi:hypothetical protein